MKPFTLPEFQRTGRAIDRLGHVHHFVAHLPDNLPNQQLVTVVRQSVCVLNISGRLYERGPDCGSDLVGVVEPVTGEAGQEA